MNRRFTYIITIIFVLNILYSTGLDSGTPYSVFEIPKCYGAAFVKIRGYNNITGDKYSFDQCSIIPCEQCKVDETLWKCGCPDSGGRSLMLNTANDVNNEYDITVEYYVEPITVLQENETNITNPTQADIENENKKRVKTFTNLKFGEVIKEKPKEPFKWPSAGEGGLRTIGLVIGGLFVIMLVLGYFLFRWLLKEGDDEGYSPSNYSKKSKTAPGTDTTNGMSDEEILELIRNNTK